jgi:hypothetical protein
MIPEGIVTTMQTISLSKSCLFEVRKADHLTRISTTQFTPGMSNKIA